MNAQPVANPPAVTEPGSAQFDLAVETFKLLGDLTRPKILWALLHSEHPVTELADQVGANPPAVSQQLTKLRAARLVRLRRQGNRIFYAAENAHVRHLVERALFHTEYVAGSAAGSLEAASGPAEQARKRRPA